MNANGWTGELREAVRDMDARRRRRLIDDLSSVINARRRERLQQILARRTRYVTVVLEDVFQSQNASAVLRSAECMGLQEVHVVENRNEFHLHPGVDQGASKWLEIYRYREKDRDNTAYCLETLRHRGYEIVAMTPRDDVLELPSLDLDGPLALCFGSEEPGLSETAHGLAHRCVKIPMCGFTRSFNLSVSAGISLYGLTTRLRDSDVHWQLADEDRDCLYIDWLARSTPSGGVLLEKFLHSPGAVSGDRGSAGPVRVTDA